MQNHRPVMLEEAITGLSLRADGIYLDGTFGRGGHSAAILARLSAQGCLHAFDRDPAAAGAARELAARHPNFHFHSAPFATLGAVCDAEGIRGRVDGILLDLGVSSPQFDDPARGFSFTHDGPLDMRMDPRSGESAADFLARAPEKEIADVLWTLGEERNSRAIARAIVAARAKQPLVRTAQLAELILSVHRGPRQKIHPATRSFQALRIHVNQELGQLAAALAQAVGVLAPGGRLVVISFHSLEDRMVKRFMRDAARAAPSASAGDRKSFSMTPAGDSPTLALVGKKQFASDAEVAANPRARSAVLRVASRCR
jgi:16S rRNA (cytosine1402-N4)-methyltransferase